MLPYALAIGIPYETFWHLNPRRMIPYEENHKNKVEREQLYMDALAWNIGAYNRAAVASLFSKKVEYPKEPLRVEQKRVENMTPEDMVRELAKAWGAVTKEVADNG